MKRSLLASILMLMMLLTLGSCGSSGIGTSQQSTTADTMVGTELPADQAGQINGDGNQIAGENAISLDEKQITYRIPEEDETFQIVWDVDAAGNVSTITWRDAKMVISFPDVAKSNEIEFRPGWLPEKMGSINTDDWRSRLATEDLGFSTYGGMNQPLLIETYSMAQFNQDGALLLLYYLPGEVIEEHWDELDVDVLRFHATQHFDAVPEMNVPEQNLEQDILILANAKAGWIIRICGEIGMDELVKIAKNLEIRETGKTLIYDDFQNHYIFIDGGVG